ncbi:hypothetical protein K491DRAFT_719463 [Lophiostoma macrostomum CBS 122681]|uniref:Isopenicillin N synthase-like Fe(2+) 2OG dioxygenase domain-containing protein n=1 Tax=Lophiostoma macrostomum CBS 122681 TaxID=1314788 RepID=A0A6A6SVU9_9PLEO|nr:hypothetical protein K491DRAFT_719463 [Lophiostoma macrostomum CBS 122681]
MEVFTNGVLKSGLHRVIEAPGNQRAHDKYSVLIVARAEDSTLMKSSNSPLIPEDTEEQKNAPVETSIELGQQQLASQGPFRTHRALPTARGKIPRRFFS